MKPIRNIENLKILRASETGSGMIVEICEGTEEGKLKEGGLYPACRIFEDDDGKKWIELYPGHEIVRIPLDLFENALRQGREDSHNEAFYD